VILKIKDGGGRHLENQKIGISLLWIDHFKKKLLCDVSYSSQLRQHVKFYAFKNSTWWQLPSGKYKNMIL